MRECALKSGSHLEQSEHAIFMWYSLLRSSVILPLNTSHMSKVIPNKYSETASILQLLVYPVVQRAGVRLDPSQLALHSFSRLVTADGAQIRGWA